MKKQYKKLTRGDRKALAESVARYRGYAEASWVVTHRVSLSSDACGLCLMYITDGCERCPVRVATGRWLCVGTPYGYRGRGENYLNLCELLGRARMHLGELKPFHKRCKQEADFLQSLLDNDPGARKETE